MVEAALRPADWVMAAIVGAAGLAPTLAAVERGAMVALANKEVLVCAGALVIAAARKSGATLLPVDSEHNAIFQCLDTDQTHAIERIVLTASGGPFRQRPLSAMANVTPAEAVAHPNWRMGAKISVDSATMMNKGLEVIEATHLFGLGVNQVDVVVHPQSVIHGLVYYTDGSVLAQLGSPDMRTPIANTLGWPRRIPAPSPRLDLAALGNLTFEAPDPERFPALRIARQALEEGGAAPIILNAANEIAVAGVSRRRDWLSRHCRHRRGRPHHARAQPYFGARSCLRYGPCHARSNAATGRQRGAPRHGRVIDRSKPVLVTGATGFVGSAVARALLTSGRSVRDSRAAEQQPDQS